jgi:hypothetical protein
MPSSLGRLAQLEIHTPVMNTEVVAAERKTENAAFRSGHETFLQATRVGFCLTELAVRKCYWNVHGMAPATERVRNSINSLSYHGLIVKNS